MFYNRGDGLPDKFDHFKLILFWVPRCSFQKKIKENGIFPVRGVGGGHPFPLLKQEGNIRQSNGKGRDRMYLVLDIVDYVPGVARGLTDGHHLGALTQMAPPDSSHTAVHQTLFCILFSIFCIFDIFSHKWHHQAHLMLLFENFVFFLVQDLF